MSTAIHDHVPAGTTPTIGTIWNGETGQGVEALLARLQAEYDACAVRVLVMPSGAQTADKGAIHRVTRRLRQAVHKRGVSLEVVRGSHRRAELEVFLASNTLNAFFQDAATAGGMRPLLGAAMAAGRPVALRRGPWCDEVFSRPHPPAFVDRRSLRSLAAGGLPEIRLVGGLWRLAAPVRRAFVGLFDSARRSA